MQASVLKRAYCSERDIVQMLLTYEYVELHPACGILVAHAKLRTYESGPLGKRGWCVHTLRTPPAYGPDIS